jgi:hypothetical protein
MDAHLREGLAGDMTGVGSSATPLGGPMRTRTLPGHLSSQSIDIRPIAHYDAATSTAASLPHPRSCRFPPACRQLLVGGRPNFWTQDRHLPWRGVS